MNNLDLLIILLLSGLMVFGYSRGFIRKFSGLVALAVALLLATNFYAGFGNFLAVKFFLTKGLANTISFFAIWFIVEFLYQSVYVLFVDRIPEEIRQSKYNHWAGLLPALIEGVLLVWFTVNLLYAVPFNPTLTKNLENSAISKLMVRNNAAVSRVMTKIFGPGANDTINFLTVRPQTNESIELGYTITNVTSNEAAAREMFDLLNKERASKGLSELAWDDKLAKLGEDHCRDMFARGYFSHNTPDGLSPFDRMDKAKIVYLTAGENLALAPSVSEAFDGLLNSPPHLANMMSSDFGKVGIGVIDGGNHGMMFAQEFTN